MNLQSVDMDSVQVHKKVIADIVYSAVNGIDGVSLIPGNWKDRICGLLGIQTFAGLTIKADDKQNVRIGIKVVIFRGMNIPDVARQLQEAVRSDLEKTVDINLKEVNVNIQGIERGR